MSRVPGLRQIPQIAGPIEQDVVLFDSWRGQYSDNPRAISEELARRGEALRHVWVLDPGLAGEVPEWVEAVEPGSRRHLAMLGRARYLVSNSTVLGFHRKRPGTTFMQTWHGPPMKRIGFDVPHDGSRAFRQAVHTLRRNVAHWDLLLSPHPYATPIFRAAFAYEGPILETGQPRNDLLVDPRAGEIRTRVRRELGIADGQRAVLYAPTFRDNASFALTPQVQRLAVELGEAHVVLLRTHKVDAGRVQMPSDRRFVDVSSYPDNRELFLAADVLVTDYSSVVFDFAVTGKPMIFYAYDLPAYRDDVRGFYFDFEDLAPGPLVFDTGALIAAVQDVEALAREHRGAYERFADRFCGHQDGQASARAADALLSA